MLIFIYILRICVEKRKKQKKKKVKDFHLNGTLNIF